MLLHVQGIFQASTAGVFGVFVTVKPQAVGSWNFRHQFAR